MIKLPTDYTTGMEQIVPSAYVSTAKSPYYVRDCARCAADGTNGWSFSTLNPARTLCDGCGGGA